MRYFEILNESRVDFLAQRYGDKLLNRWNAVKGTSQYTPFIENISDENTAMSLIDFLSNGDPTRNKKYLQWLVDRWCRGTFQFNDLEMINQQLELHAKLVSAKRLENSDINSIATPSDLYDLLTPYMSGEKAINAVDEERKHFMDPTLTQVVHYSSDFYIVRPLTFESERYWGQNTNWCTVANKRYFDDYSADDDLYIIGAGDRRWQISFSAGELRKENDHWADIENIPQQVWNYFPDDRFYDFILSITDDINDPKTDEGFLAIFRSFWGKFLAFTNKNSEDYEFLDITANPDLPFIFWYAHSMANVPMDERKIKDILNNSGSDTLVSFVLRLLAMSDRKGIVAFDARTREFDRIVADTIISNPNPPKNSCYNMAFIFKYIDPKNLAMPLDLIKYFLKHGDFDNVHSIVPIIGAIRACAVHNFDINYILNKTDSETLVHIYDEFRDRIPEITSVLKSYFKENANKIPVFSKVNGQEIFKYKKHQSMNFLGDYFIANENPQEQDNPSLNIMNLLSYREPTIYFSKTGDRFVCAADLYESALQNYVAFIIEDKSKANFIFSVNRDGVNIKVKNSQLYQKSKDFIEFVLRDQAKIHGEYILKAINKLS